MPENKTPKVIADLLRPLTQTQSERRVWSIPLNTVWVPFFTAAKVQGVSNMSNEALGAPVRLGRAKDGSVRFGANGKPVLQVNKELATGVRTVRNNFVASLMDFTSHTAKTRAEDYKAQLMAAAKAAAPVVEADQNALDAALNPDKSGDAEATKELITEALEQADTPTPEPAPVAA